MDQSHPSNNLRSLLMPSGLPGTQRKNGREMAKGLVSPPPPPPPPPPRSAENLLDKVQSESHLTSETRNAMSELLQRSAPASTPVLPVTTQTASTPSSTVSAHLAIFLPSFLTLKAQILQDLETNLARLLALNMSRRESVAQYLDRLSGHTPGPTTASGNVDAAGGLRRWIEGPRSPAQNTALQAYFEEVALVILGQSILLKAWSDRGLRAWSDVDLKDLNWAMHTALKPHIPLDRESWQIARQNIYSWYKPSPLIQREIWNTLEGWKIAGEGSEFLSRLFACAKKASPEHVEPQGYDSRLFKAIWDNMPIFGFDPAASPGPLKRQWAAFSPTLREGAMVRTGHSQIHWIGLESSSFQLMLAELMQLWWGQSAPPLWNIGNGLEVHTRDQLTLSLGSPKPSLMSRIAEMEACDVAFVLEERAVRAQGRSAEAQRFREQIDAIPYFKKLRAAGTTLGDLQACVAISKLRPGGLLWWSREEPLEARDGSEMLNFMLERGKLVCEWNFSEVSHTLSTAGSSKPIFPKFLYLFMREARVEERLSNRPLRLTAQGKIRIPVEIPLLLEDALHAACRAASPRGQWQLHVQQSPSTQKEWADRWPDPTSQNTVRFVERLRESSLPLASATTIRHTPEGDPSRGHAWSIHTSLHGFWVQAQQGPEGRKLTTHPLPRPGREAQGSGFMILVTDENSIAPLMHYLESATVNQWLEFHCERRGDRWILNEQVVRWIPVPKLFLRTLGLGAPAGESEGMLNGGSSLSAPLPGEWEKMASQIAFHPAAVREAVDRLHATPATSDVDSARRSAIFTELFVRASRAVESLRTSAGPLLNLVNPDGKIRWAQLLKILPKAETTSITLHPRITMSGNLPLHLPIGQMVPTKTPSPGILLATEAGLNMKIHTDSPLLLEMLWDQIDGLSSPTWSELLQYLRLPRRLELAETTATDVLRSHGEQTKRIRDLVELLAACTVF